MTFDLSVKNLFQFYLIIAGGALGVLLLIIIIIVAVIKKGKPAFSRTATLVVQVDCDGDMSDGVSKLGRYGKKPVKLSTICSNCRIDTFSMRGVLDKVLVAPRKKGGIEVSYNIKGVGKKTIVMNSMDDRTIELDSDGDRLIELSYDAGDNDY